MAEKIPEIPERNYYKFEDMLDGGHKSFTCTDVEAAKKARSAAHGLGSRNGWKFRTHLSKNDDGNILLDVWRVA